jgi:hypothetical protein
MDDDVKFSPDIIVTAIFIDCFGFPIYIFDHHTTASIMVMAQKAY